MAETKRGPTKGGFGKGYDARRVKREPAKPKDPPKHNIAVINLMAKGVPEEEAVSRGTASQFKPGFDPRRPFTDKAKAEQWGKLAPRPGIARAAARMAFFERIPWLAAVVDGEPQARVVRKWIKDEKHPEGGTWRESEFFETPDVENRIKAMQLLGEMAGVKTMSITDGDDGNVPPANNVWMLSNLTTEQLKALRELAQMAKPQRGLKELSDSLMAGGEVQNGQ